MIRVTIQQPSLAKYRVPVFRELARRPGIDLTVIYGERSDLPNVPPDGFRAIPYPLRRIQAGGQQFWYHTPQWSWATRRKSDVLLLTWNVRYASLVPGLLRARAARVATVLWGHGYSKREHRARSRARRAAAGLATALLFYNHAAADAYRDSGVDAAKIFVALNSLDQSPVEAARTWWEQHPNELTEFRRTHQLDARPLVLYVSRLDPANRVDLLIRAVAHLHQRGQLVELAIVGSGEREIAELKTLAASLGVGPQVRFLGPIYDEHQLAAWFASAAVFCYPENIGLSLLHAFGYGAAVVTTAGAEIHNPEFEALADNVNGVLVPRNDPVALGETIGSLVNDPERRQRLGSAALATVRKRFSLSNMVDGMQAAIEYSHGRVRGS
jgi:glycosyltransferase involved in cell wall biosynthesis